MTWAVVPEKAEQAAGVKLLQALGAHVYVLGTTRRKGDHQGTMQTPGLPDVQAFLPVFRSNAFQILMWEVKRAKGGRVSPAQKDYQALCHRAGVAHVVGPASALEAWLRQEGYLR